MMTPAPAVAAHDSTNTSAPLEQYSMPSSCDELNGTVWSGQTAPSSLPHQKSQMAKYVFDLSGALAVGSTLAFGGAALSGNIVLAEGGTHQPPSHERLAKLINMPATARVSEYISDIEFSAITESLSLKGFGKSAHRINELKNFDELEEGEEPLSMDSLRGFSAFMPTFTKLGEPSLGLFPEGTLSAGWRIANNKHLLIEFLNSTNISFAIIKPDDNNPEGKFRLNGRGGHAAVLSALKQNGVTQWQV